MSQLSKKMLPKSLCLQSQEVQQSPQAFLNTVSDNGEKSYSVIQVENQDVCFKIDRQGVQK